MARNRGPAAGPRAVVPRAVVPRAVVPRAVVPRAVAPCALVLVAVLGALAGCGTSRSGSAGDTAQAFHAALAAGDGVRGCALVAPRTSSALEESSGLPCPRAVLAQHLAVVSDPEAVRVFGTMAEVRFADEVTFLARFADGWRVVAAACAPTTRDRPHDCRIQGS